MQVYPSSEVDNAHIISDFDSCLLSDVTVSVRFINLRMRTQWLNNSLSATAHLLVSEPKSTGSTSPGRADMTELADSLMSKAGGRVLQFPWKPKSTRRKLGDDDRSISMRVANRRS